MIANNNGNLRVPIVFYLIHLGGSDGLQETVKTRTHSRAHA